MSDIVIQGKETGSIAPGQDAHGNQIDDNGKIIKANPIDVDPGTGEVASKANLLSDPVKPDWCPNKFWNKETGQVNQEGLAKSYAELEKKKGAPTKGAKKDLELDPAKAVADAGLNFEDFATEYAETGELSEDSYTALEAGGLSKDLVDQYIKGQEAIANTQITEMKALVGGEKNYEKLSTWASTALSEAEIEAYNDNVNSGNPERVKLAIRGLNAKFQEATGQNPSLTFGNMSEGSGGSAFRSWAEVTKAMKDDRYNTDPAYRQDIEQKIGRSKLD